MDVKNINVLTLAYIGDAIYEVYVREFLIKQGIYKINTLHQEAIKYVSAKNQAEFIKKFLDTSFLNDEERKIIFRARNHKEAHKPKNTDIVTYKYATGLEALIGYLYLENRQKRIEEIMKEVLKQC